jgi:uncharacterized protein (TIGR03032 family)
VLHLHPADLATPLKVVAMTEPQASPAAAAQAAEPLQSIYTHSVPELLQTLGCSVMVTTYQAGRLVLLRAEPGAQGGQLNSHFRAFNKPMGLASERGRVALGTVGEIWEFHDIQGIREKLNKPGEPLHDAAYLPRSIHFTGDIQIHEMAWVPDPSGLSTLWFVNTRFSCLATRSGIFSFTPRWRPKFISALAPEDRCHLNGMALRESQIRYVTALGESDRQGGWRDNKRSGGILMDVPSNEIIARGFSMPHSPRWHEGRLWILDSGNGGMGVVDQQTGKYEEVCRMPGFTRGLDFVGPYAFVGLSQVRESAIFSGIAIAELKPEDRSCGMWVVDTRSGTIAGFVKFTNAVQEVFAVQVLPSIRWPDVVTHDAGLVAGAFELGPEALAQLPEKVRQ